MDVFDPAHPNSHRLTSIPIRERHYRGENPYALIEAVMKTVQTLDHYGAYLRHELPIETRLSCQVSNYEGEVCNGGHEQFISNSGWSQEVQADVDQGLAAMGALAIQTLFREVAQRVNIDAKELEAVRARGGFDHRDFGKVDNWIGDKDSAFYTLKRETDFAGMHAAWLRSLECIQSVPDLEWKFVIAGAIQAQTLREARLHAKGQRASDFLADIRTQAPLIKPLEVYVGELGARHKIALSDLPTRSWRTWPQGRLIWRGVFETRRPSIWIGLRYQCFLAEFITATNTLVLYRLKNLGHDDIVEIVGPAIGQITLERCEE